MRRLLLTLSLLLVCLGALAQAPQSAATPKPAGKVELVEGDVTVFDKAKKARRVAVGEVVHEGEGIVTGRDGELHLDMEDGGFIAVRPNTRMSIAAYRAEGPFTGWNTTASHCPSRLTVRPSSARFAASSN